jgi:hypothetical protein
MVNGYGSVITFLTITEEENNHYGAKAYGLLNSNKSFVFFFFVNFISSMFDKTSILQKSFQDPGVDISTALDLLKTTVASLESMLFNYFFVKFFQDIDEKPRNKV